MGYARFPSQDPNRGFRRNTQPAARGRSTRIGGETPYNESEIDYLRQSKLKGKARAGNLYAHWRRYTFDWNGGLCRRCYRYRNDASVERDCPVCYGTGWDGGYSAPSVQWMIVLDTSTNIQWGNSGLLRVRVGTSESPHIPRISPNDILGFLVYRNNLWQVGDRYVVTGNIEEERARDQIDSLQYGTHDHLDPLPEVVGYRFQSSLLPRYPEGEERFELPEYKIPFENPFWLANPMEAVAQP